MKSLSDQELIQSYLQGRHDSLEILINRHQQKVLSYILMAVRDKHLADDLFQDVFIRVIHKLRSGIYQDEGKFLPWVIRIAHNVIIDHFRRNSRIKIVEAQENDDSLLLSSELSEVSAEDKLISLQIKKDVKKLIQFLPEDQREVIIMRVYEDMSFKDIADSTNVSINTALGRMRYALINLRKLIEENNISINI